LSSVFLSPLFLALALIPVATAANELSVCADPNNLPYSNEQQQGFENRIAEVVSDELGYALRYVWWAHRRGLVSNALNEGVCDVIIGTGSIDGVLLTYPPYYRSIYTVVAPADQPAVVSFDDARLADLTIGVELVGGEGAGTPPAAALASRGLTQNVRGYSVLGDYSQASPLSRIVQAVADGEVDIAYVWGPVAAYFAQHESVPLKVTPLDVQFDGPERPLAFDISMAVRLDKGALRLKLEQAIAARRTEIDKILADYRVPRLDLPASTL
jgi:mxaJ protein